MQTVGPNYACLSLGPSGQEHHLPVYVRQAAEGTIWILPGLEPMGWPLTLDVTLRIDIKYVLQMVSAGVASNLAAVRRLVLTPGAEAETHSR